MIKFRLSDAGSASNPRGGRRRGLGVFGMNGPEHYTAAQEFLAAATAMAGSIITARGTVTAALPSADVKAWQAVADVSLQPPDEEK